MLIIGLFAFGAFAGCIGGDNGGEDQISPDKGRICGTITNETGSLVAGAVIILVDTYFEAVSDENGEYEIVDVDPGNYTMEIRLEGYITASGISIKVVGGESTLQDVVLTSGSSVPSKYKLALYLDGASGATPAGVDTWAQLLLDPPTDTEDDVTTYVGANVALLGTAVGGWEVPQPFGKAVDVKGAATISLWAQATTPAVQVSFMAFFTVNGVQVPTEDLVTPYCITTETKDLTGTDPVEFKGEAGIPTIELGASDKLGIEVWIYAVENVGEMGTNVLCGSIDHPSNVTVTLKDK